MYPPPKNGKVEISGQCDILVLADVPPPRIGNLKQVRGTSDVPPPTPGLEKLKQVIVTSDVPPPLQNGKVEISGQCDILVLADVPPPQDWKS